MTKKQKDLLVRELTNGMRLVDVARLLRLTVAEVRAAQNADKDFAREIRRAPIIFKRYLLHIVVLGEQNWQAAAFILERRWPLQWGKSGSDRP